MKFIEPDDIDLTVEPKHLSEQEKSDISAFIQQYKAEQGKEPTGLKIEISNRKDLDFLIALFQRLGLKWTFSEG